MVYSVEKNAFFLPLDVIITNNTTEFSNNKHKYVTNKMLKTLHKMFSGFREISTCVVNYFGGTQYTGARFHGSKSVVCVCVVCVVAVRQTTL